jgi:hypothetical protein
MGRMRRRPVAMAFLDRRRLRMVDTAGMQVAVGPESRFYSTSEA